MNRKEYNKKYYEENKEEIKKKQLDYRNTHKEQLSSMHARHYKENKDRIKEERAQYQKENPDKCRVYRSNHRVRKTGAGGKFTTQEWFTLCFAVGFRCLCCGEVRPLEADHVIPVSLGGCSFLYNIQPLCESCNCKKQDKCTDYRG